MGVFRRLAWQAILEATGDTRRELARLQQWERLAPAPAAALQQERLGALLCHARATVPYYRELFAERGLGEASPAELVDAFASLPLLDKATIRSQGDRLLASDAASRRPFGNTSGGSTGEPVRLTQDAAYRDASRAVAMHFAGWAGYRAGQPMVKLWGSERDLFVGRETWRTRLVRGIRHERWLNAFRMTPAQLREHVATLQAARPEFVLGYVESLYEVARHVLAEGVRLPAPGAVMTAAGPLEPPVREAIARAFRAPVFNRYGSREVGDIASECEQHAGLHVCAPYHVVELLDERGRAVGPGERGEVVITLLTNRSMPLVRYRIGDVASWAAAPCACGRPWPLLENVAGRVTDIFRRADGTSVHGEYFTHLFYFVPWIRKFQVVQESFERVVVRIVPRTAGDAESPVAAHDLAEITDKIRLVLGAECDVRVETCDVIEPTASGKFRYTISHVPA